MKKVIRDYKALPVPRDLLGRRDPKAIQARKGHKVLRDLRVLPELKVLPEPE